MGDLALETALTPIGDADSGTFTATLDPAWEIWGPMGGYVAAIALRAAGACSPFSRPASLACHYLGVASFGEVQLTVTTQRMAKTACSQRVEMTQGDRPILTADVWSIGEVDGLEHHEVDPPDVPGPDGPSREELLGDEERWFPFWDNLDSRPINFTTDWPPEGPMEPRWRMWMQFRPTPTFPDPWLDAMRSVILVDLVSWPSAHQHHAWRKAPFIAPSLDLYVAFHEPCPDEAWLLADGFSPRAGQGLLSWQGNLWSASRRLVATGGGQALFRRFVPPT